MGNYISISSNPPRRSSSTSAKLVIDDGLSLPANIPSFKVLIHEQLAQSASNSIEGSTILAQEISKSLVVDLLRSKENTKKFGVLLGDIFKFNSILEPTRSLMYWSIQTETSMKNMFELSSYGVAWFLAQPFTSDSTNLLISNYLRDPYFVDFVSKPYFVWLFTDREYCIKPLAQLIDYHLPLQKEAIHSAVKDEIISRLKSQSTRDIAKSSVVEFMRKYSNRSNKQ